MSNYSNLIRKRLLMALAFVFEAFDDLFDGHFPVYLIWKSSKLGLGVSFQEVWLFPMLFVQI